MDIKKCSENSLQRAHEPEAIRARLRKPISHSYVGDALLGGIDGCVTTFAIIAGAIGAGFDTRIVVIVGCANLLADGASMAISNYQNARSRMELISNARKDEAHHIMMVPDGEREEIRQIFAQKGFSGDILEQIVDTITADKDRWINTMVTEELGLPTEAPNAFTAAYVTFAAFVLAGLIPLLPFLFSLFTKPAVAVASAGMTALAFFLIGVGKGWALNQGWLRSGVTTLFQGGIAACIAFAVGYSLNQLYGV
jgi:VIT1/CCC1 family predicted Fe2+/Mn2+ transporter